MLVKLLAVDWFQELLYKSIISTSNVFRVGCDLVVKSPSIKHVRKAQQQQQCHFQTPFVVRASSTTNLATRRHLIFSLAACE